jgi:hypothetical protein
MADNEQIRNVLFAAGPQWGERSPDDIIQALDVAGYAIVPKRELSQLRVLLGACRHVVPEQNTDLLRTIEQTLGDRRESDWGGLVAVAK